MECDSGIWNVQWNLSKADTIGASKIVPCTEVALVGRSIVSGCDQFRSAGRCGCVKTD